MKRIIFMSVALLVAVPLVASAQTTPSTVPLADVAKKEEDRQKQTKKPSRVFTNNDLKPDFSKPVAPPPTVGATAPSANATPGNATAGNGSPAAPAAAAAPAKDQAYWQGRIKTVRDELSRAQIFMDALQSRINGLTTEYVNRDDPAQRDKVDADRRTALAELERVKKEIDAKNKEIAAIEDEARRAGVPPGWLRPPV